LRLPSFFVQRGEGRVPPRLESGYVQSVFAFLTFPLFFSGQVILFERSTLVSRRSFVPRPPVFSPVPLRRTRLRHRQLRTSAAGEFPPESFPSTSGQMLLSILSLDQFNHCWLSGTPVLDHCCAFSFFSAFDLCSVVRLYRSFFFRMRALSEDTPFLFFSLLLRESASNLKTLIGSQPRVRMPAAGPTAHCCFLFFPSGFLLVFGGSLTTLRFLLRLPISL